VLERLGVPRGVFERSDEHWSRFIGADGPDDGAAAVLARFGKAYAETRADLRSRRAELPAVARAATEPPDAPAEPPVRTDGLGVLAASNAAAAAGPVPAAPQLVTSTSGATAQHAASVESTLEVALPLPASTPFVAPDSEAPAAPPAARPPGPPAKGA